MMGQGQQTFKTLFGSQLMTIETNKLALNADTSVLIRYGATTLLSTFVKKKQQAQTPLFAIQLQASTTAFDWALENAKLQQLPWTHQLNQVAGQAMAINNLVLTTAQPTAAGLAAVFGSSLAAYLADALDTPLVAVHVARVGDKFILNPTSAQTQQATLELTLVGQQTGLLLLNGWADNLTTATILAAVAFGQQAIARFCGDQITIKSALKGQGVKTNRANMPTIVPQALQQPLSMTTEFGPGFAGTGLLQQGRDQVLSRIRPEKSTKTAQLQMTYRLPDFAFDKRTLRTPRAVQAQLDQHFLTQILQSVLPKASVETLQLDTQVLTASGGHLAAAVTANTLALLAAAVPLKRSVVAVALNIFQQQSTLKLGVLPQNAKSLGQLTVAGTYRGVTAITGASPAGLFSQELLQNALAEAQSARQQLLATLAQTLGQVLPIEDDSR
ncbi:hypothetical protein FC83_GL002469 [Agrilactobacillus composti DSM 18527 = JCM 14202]|uniref:Uncharacterized protein n=1 Tax=Agrilactobacillus composti DSM 18527 = JCM 14202 TaxID=1423734 RepID=X0QKF2_9LACO|nr:hypothetical protein [Agrilactobacillus composti]KRM36595.1 hypothetical protein FC83_GL002469 [Agrilactobacillus composti DSM 18527 = JCM 14202]GAF39080.1 polyribonucleotide nucleotidyltransferase [Agrilactobacillus composti DSM 18527 = JCM 14202]